MLLPGDLEIVARLAGYEDFVKTIVIEPGQGQKLRVVMYKTRGVPPREENAKLEFSVSPKRSDNFLDDQFMMGNKIKVKVDFPKGSIHDAGPLGRAKAESPRNGQRRDYRRTGKNCPKCRVAPPISNHSSL